MPRILSAALLLLAFLLLSFPIAWMVLTAFKDGPDVYSASPFFTPTLENFTTIFGPPWSIGDKLANSLIVSFVTVAIAVPVAMLAAYGFSRFPLRFKRALFVGLLATQFLPAVVIVLPFFLMFRDLGLLDSRTGLVIVNLAIVTPFAIWMLKGYIDGLPIETEEAAVVDGASRMRVILDIVVPMVRPGLIVTAAFCFILTWNEFIFALILARQDAVTLPVGITAFRTERGDLWELIAAAGIIITAPAFAISLIVQRHLVRGMTAGAVR
jgi:multiple sugar transport system permease protein